MGADMIRRMIVAGTLTEPLVDVGLMHCLYPTHSLISRRAVLVRILVSVLVSVVLVDDSLLEVLPLIDHVLMPGCRLNSLSILANSYCDRWKEVTVYFIAQVIESHSIKPKK